MPKLLVVFAAAAIAGAPRSSVAQTLNADTTARIDAVFARLTPPSPGCALNVLRNGASIYSRGYGLASIELGVPVSPQSVFDIGSSSKQFTAASIVLLAIDKKLSLDDDIRKYIPELPDLGAKVTLRQLLNHTSGWRDYDDLMELGEFVTRDHTTDNDALDILRRQRTLNFTPGSDWRYSNTGFFLMSLVVKRVTGMSLADFARRRIFEPLGMTHTHFLTEPREVIAHKATAYSPGPGGAFLVDMSNWEQIGDGGVQTSVEDLARWDANFDAPVVGGKEMVDLLQTTATLSNGTPLTYALGLVVDEYRGVRRIQHNGAWAGYHAITMRFPSRRFSIYILCNRGDVLATELANGVANVFIAAPPNSSAVIAPTPGQAAQLAGIYVADGTGQLLDLEARGDTLMPRGSPPLEPIGPGRFRQSSGSTLTFDSAAGARRLVLASVATGAPTTYVAVPPAGQVRAADFVGRYGSAELPGDWTVYARGDSMFVRRPRIEETYLRPLFRDGFDLTDAGALVRFTRDRAGRVTGLSVTTRGVHALRMDRR